MRQQRLLHAAQGFEFLLRRAPFAISIAKEGRLLPLDIAIYHLQTPSLIQMLVAEHPSTIHYNHPVPCQLNRFTLLDWLIDLWH